ncbi:peroxiredoxin [Bradyrhizobium jicamae]|uniref:peroxiredoxin n=1 Tax=Bradyrhizobium jicamae TaxID=280332 RepID=UPI001BAC5131|nr:peroxiredoxin [Bradyrhizobium jicamae]MBR0753910.1 peroxiredoxin [Bradyrhizobium jicamae]
MSKKTRKKSSSTTAKRAPAKAARAVKTAAKTSAVKTRTTKPPGKVGKTAPTKASHKAPSKGLKTKAAAPKTAAPAKAVSGLAEGAKAPAFTLPRDGGSSVSLADFAGQKLVLFFYPRADTPGCTREAIDFTRLRSDFAAAGAAVLGISADTVKAQESFRNKHQLSVPLISDEAHEMLEAYGAWGEKSMYGRTFLGIIRTTVLVDASGKIAKIWRNVRVDGHADEVLAAARSLSS